MGWTGKVAAQICCAYVSVLLGASAIAGPTSIPDFGRNAASPEARHAAHWTLQSSDHRGLPFAIVDKKEARIHVFDSNGTLRGTSPVLLGQAPGDHTVPGVGDRAQTGRIPVHERTTPAGRFESQPGYNLAGEHVVWVDWDSALAIHRLRPGVGFRDRQARLASPIASAHRASLGCVVVPVAFYEEVVKEVLGRSRSVVYVLPESKPLSEMLESL
jgi:hypothetical protein